MSFLLYLAGLSCLVMLCLHVMATLVSYAVMVAVTLASLGKLLFCSLERTSCIEIGIHIP